MGNETNREEIIEESVEVSQTEVKKTKKQLTKNDKSRALIEDAKILISSADSEVKEVEDVVAQHVSEFKTHKKNLTDKTFVETRRLLEKAHYEYNQDEEDEPFELSLGTTQEKIRLKNVTTGRFTGLIFALLGMLATAVAWLFVASTKTGSVVVLDKVPEQSTLDAIFTWIGGGMTSGAGNPLFGMIVVAVSSLLVGLMVYKLRVAMRENKNFKVANETLEKSHVYVEEQKESKGEMERIDEHIKVSTPLVESYAVILDEQNAKLKRVLHVEGSLEDTTEYHTNSKHAMSDAANLMKRAERLVNIPVSKEGRLNEASVNAYNEAKALYDTYITQVYA